MSNEIDQFIAQHANRLDTRKLRNNMHIVWDKDGSITSEKFNINALPETAVLSPKGEIVRKVIGQIDWNSRDIKQYIKRLLNE